MKAMKTVVVAGAKGYVGSQIASSVARSGCYRLIRVVRGDDAKSAFASADIIVHAANPARRYRAEKDPIRDFTETVEKTAQFLDLAKGKRFVLVSSLSCRTQLATAYGRNRRACELLALNAAALVVRLGPMFGGGRTQDCLHDIIAGRTVYVAADTRYAYVDVSWAGDKIVSLLEGPVGICEIGARNSVQLSDIRDRFASQSAFVGETDTQEPEGASDGPDAAEVFEFAEHERSRIGEWR